MNHRGVAKDIHQLLDQAIVIAKGLVEREPENAEYQRYHDFIKDALAEMRE